MNRETTYLFVDGNWLRQRLADYERIWYKELIEADFANMQSWTGATKCFFYDAYPSEEAENYSELLQQKEQEFAAISLNPGWHVNSGLTRGVGRKLRQKGVDVKLAIDAMAHHQRGNFTKAIIIAGDLDFLPLITALVEAGAWVELWCDYRKTPSLLYLAADSRKCLFPLVAGKGSAHPFKIDQKNPRNWRWEPCHPSEILETPPTHRMRTDGFEYLLFRRDRNGIVYRKASNGVVESWEEPNFDEQVWLIRQRHPLGHFE